VVFVLLKSRTFLCTSPLEVLEAGERQAPGTGPFFGEKVHSAGKMHFAYETVARNHGPVPFVFATSQFSCIGRHLLDTGITICKIRSFGKTVMNLSPRLRPWIAILLGGGVFLPIAICLVFGVGSLLSQMGDTAGWAVLSRISLALTILWVFDLIVLLLFQGLNSLVKDHEDSNPSEDS
jgi:hypothetical protein